MNTFTDKTEQFLDTAIHPMSRSLAIAVIDRAGSEDDFVDNHEVYGQSGVPDNSEEGDETFFEQNITEINSYLNGLAAELGEDEVSTIVLSSNQLDQSYSAVEVDDVLSGKKGNRYSEVATAITGFVGSDLALAYERFLEDEDNVDSDLGDDFDDMEHQADDGY